MVLSTGWVPRRDGRRPVRPDARRGETDGIAVAHRPGAPRHRLAMAPGRQPRPPPRRAHSRASPSSSARSTHAGHHRRPRRRRDGDRDAARPRWCSPPRRSPRAGSSAPSCSAVSTRPSTPPDSHSCRSSDVSSSSSSSAAALLGHRAGGGTVRLRRRHPSRVRERLAAGAARSAGGAGDHHHDHRSGSLDRCGAGHRPAISRIGRGPGGPGRGAAPPARSSSSPSWRPACRAAGQPASSTALAWAPWCWPVGPSSPPAPATPPPASDGRLVADHRRRSVDPVGGAVPVPADQRRTGGAHRAPQRGCGARPAPNSVFGCRPGPPVDLAPSSRRTPALHWCSASPSVWRSRCSRSSSTAPRVRRWSPSAPCWRCSPTSAPPSNLLGFDAGSLWIEALCGGPGRAHMAARSLAALPNLLSPRGCRASWSASGPGSGAQSCWCRPSPFRSP